MRGYIYPKVATLALSVVLVTQTACGGGALTTFRLALASSGPLISSLVASGAIRQDQAEPIVRDFSDGADIALTLQTDFKGCASDRGCKLQAAQRAETGFRAIINRHHFAANARIQQVADLADGILASLVIFYGGSSSGKISVMRAEERLTDSEIEARLKPDVEKLKRMMKP